MTNSPSIVSPISEKSLTISENNGIQCVSARELYKGLEVSKRFSEWFSTNSKDFVENEDFSRVYLKVRANRYGGEQDIEDYSISIEMAKSICLMSRTEIGKQYRQYLIQLEKTWNTPEAVMARALQLANKTLDEIKEQNKLLLPDAEAWRAFSEKSGNYCVTNVGRLLNVSPKLIFNYLETKGFICRDQRTGKYIGTMEGVSRGFIANEIWKNDNKSGIQMRLTPEGMKKIADAFGKTESSIAKTADKWAETNYLNPNAEPCSLKRE